ncbi:MAG: helix-turn-helix transcriptional regulator [Eggerthellaceae bacterium]|nr:helix-turn-helix transcriptional regulator [Eggerthellaceae bacterium]
MSLKDKRKESGMTQHQAAELFGIKYRTYQNYENGVTSPDMDTAAVFARHFSCTIGDLFDLEEGAAASLEPEEARLVEMFRNMTPDGRAALLAVCREFARIFTTEK